jgi:hypothetical protein
MDADRYAKIVRASALYDLIVTAAFVMPWTFMLVHWGLVALDTGLDLPGTVPDVDPMSMLLGNLLGSVVVVWSLVRLHLRLPVLGRYDAVARFLFAAWQINAMASGLSIVILPLTVIEIGFGIAQAISVRRRGAGL